MTLAELRALALATGFANPSIAAAVAMAESGGNPSAVHIVTSPAPGNLPERSFGLWQINTLAHPQYDEARLLEPAYNAQAALAISGGGTRWSAWSTFNDKSYGQYMPGGAVVTRTAGITLGFGALALALWRGGRLKF